MSLEKDRAFFRNFSIVVAILAIMMVLFFIAASIAGSYVTYGDQDLRERKIAERTAPVGESRTAEASDKAGAEPAATPEAAGTEVAVAEAEGEAAGSEAIDGKAIYQNNCAACHSTGLPNIPQLGDADAWAPRIEQGMDTLYKHAIEGFQGSGGMMMPPRGGNPGLSDEQVKAAVDYVVENSQ